MGAGLNGIIFGDIIIIIIIKHVLIKVTLSFQRHRRGTYYYYYCL